MNECVYGCMHVCIGTEEQWIWRGFEKCMHFQVEVMMHKAKEAAMDCQNATARDVETAYRLSHLTRVCVLCCVVLYCTVLYCIVLYCIVLFVMYCIVLDCIVLYSIVFESFNYVLVWVSMLN